MAEANALFSEMELLTRKSTSEPFGIGLQDFLEAAFLPKLMKRFQPFSHVDIRVILQVGQRGARPETGKLDLIVDVRPIDRKNIPVKYCLRTRFYRAAKAPSVGRKSPLSTEDFDQLEYVIVRPHQIEFHSAEPTLRADGHSGKSRLKPVPQMIVPQIVAETDFASTMPRRLFSGAIAAYKLKTHSMPFEFPPMRLMMVSAGSCDLILGIRWLKEQFKLLPYNKHATGKATRRLYDKGQSSYPNSTEATFDLSYYRDRHMPMAHERFGDACKEPPSTSAGVWRRPGITGALHCNRPPVL